MRRGDVALSLSAFDDQLHRLRYVEQPFRGVPLRGDGDALWCREGEAVQERAAEQEDPELGQVLAWANAAA